MCKVSHKEIVLTLEFFRKHYCPFCGRKLERKKKIVYLHKGDPGFLDSFSLGLLEHVYENRVQFYYYVCNYCNEKFSNDDVAKIRKLQKKSKKIILEGYKQIKGPYYVERDIYADLD